MYIYWEIMAVDDGNPFEPSFDMLISNWSYVNIFFPKTSLCWDDGRGRSNIPHNKHSITLYFSFIYHKHKKTHNSYLNWNHISIKTPSNFEFIMLTDLKGIECVRVKRKVYWKIWNLSLPRISLLPHVE